MKKGMRLIKRMAALFLVLLLSIESFGAVLSDNDGSAFITKAEFDSLRNDFQAQVDQYNQSIDSKIDGAIAQYLAGVNIQTSPDNYYARLKSVIGNKNPYFLRINQTGSNAITSNVVVSKAKNYSIKYAIKTNPTFEPAEVWLHVKWTNGSGIENWTMAAYSGDTWKGDQTDAMNIANNYNMFYRLTFDVWPDQSVRFRIGGTWYTWPAGTKKYLNTAMSDSNSVSWAKNSAKCDIDWTTMPVGGTVTIEEKFNGEDYKKGYIHRTIEGITGKAAPNPKTTNFNTHSPVTASAARNGSGTQWTYESNPDGSKSLKRYWTTFYPQQLITLNYKTYKDGGTVTDDIKQDAFKETTVNTYNPSITPKYGRVVDGTNHTSYGTQNNVGYCEEIFSLITQSADTNDYRTAQWGTGTANNIYASTESPALVAKSTNLNTYTDLAASTVNIGGVTHATTKVTNNVKEVTINPETLPLNTFVNTYYTGIAGESVRMGYGIPIMRANADFGTRYNITIKMKMSDFTTGNDVVGNVNCKLSNNHFINGEFASTVDKLYESTYNITSTVENTLTIPLDNIPKGQQVWLNIYPTADGRKVEVTGFDVTIS